MGTRDKRMMIDLCVPTNAMITERKPDLLTKERKIIIFEVAISWDPRVQERETEKRAKYSRPGEAVG